MPIENFDRYDAFQEKLLTLNIDEEERNFILEHERQHFDRAVELGYQPFYLINYEMGPPQEIYYYGIDFKGKKPTGKHLGDILLAPDMPSFHDIEMAKKIALNFEQS